MTVGGVVEPATAPGVGLGVAVLEGSAVPAGGAVVKAEAFGVEFFCQANCQVAGFQLDVFQLVEFHEPLLWQPANPTTTNKMAIRSNREETRMTRMSL